jgi:biopolymer transport protein ExbB
MIGTFNQLSKGGDMAMQSRSIGLALFATALGLVTAIPLVFTHVLFKAWIASFEIKMKSAAHKLILLIQAQPTKPAAPAKAKDTAVTPRA